MANRIQLRRGNGQEWQGENPTLAQGEIGIELDTGRIKIGDGVTAWNTLRYERPIDSTSATANSLVKRDADGNFQAGTITATLIGNASTATRLSSTRQIALVGELSGSQNWDGSTNLNINAELAIVTTLSHFDGSNTSSGTYNRVTVDAKGRVIGTIDYTLNNNATLADYGLDGTISDPNNRGASSAQPYDTDLVAYSDLTTAGIVVRKGQGDVQTRTIEGAPGYITMTNGAGTGTSTNIVIDLTNTAVVPTQNLHV